MTTAAVTAAQPGVVPPVAAAPRPGDVPADTHALRARWPDVLAAVQGRKRVAWMQLSNASVESFADGVLTLTFAQAGVAKGFVTGGYDKDLGQVLSEMFGMTPTIRTSVGDPQPGPGPSYSSPSPAVQRPAASQRAGDEPDRTADVDRAGPSDRPADPGRRGGTSRAPEASVRGSTGRPVPRRADDNEPAPGDLPAPDVLTGTNLIERELGGRVIQELDGP